MYGVGHQKYRYLYVCAHTFVGETAKFNMTFVSLRNTPLDIYFLTDVSASLQFSINALREGITNICKLLLFTVMHGFRSYGCVYEICCYVFGSF